MPSSNPVVLGWGSLLWNTGELAVAGAWSPLGPTLPIEFSRIAKDDRLTLVIDRLNGARVQTYWARLAVDDLEGAISALADREECPDSGIGWLDVRARTNSLSRHSDQEDVFSTIEQWARSVGVTHAVWTALPSTFEARREEPFSVTCALDYLRSLGGPERERAFEYIRRAPKATQTPLRAHFDREFG